jgi:4'-phosphopantetheinyl transferase
MPAADEVQVVVLHLDGGGSPQQRRAEAGRRLREVLAAVLGMAAGEVELVTGRNGKPELATGTLRFNLSHSGDLALVAVTRDREVGVDVERVDLRRDVARLARRALDPAAAEAVLALPAAERSRAFHRAWARREAVAKCAGTGLSVPVPDTPRQVHDLEVAEGYAGAVAVAGDRPTGVRVLDVGD